MSSEGKDCEPGLPFERLDSKRRRALAFKSVQ